MKERGTSRDDVQYYKFCISGFLTWLSLYNFSFFVSVVLSVWLKCADSNVFRRTASDRNRRSGAGFSPLSCLATSGRRVKQTQTMRRKEKEFKHNPHVESVNKISQMNVLISTLVTNSSFLSWLPRKWNDPLPGRGSLDSIGLYINNQTHSVVFIMCAKCLLCYFKKLINEYKSIYITLYIYIHIQYTFFWKLCNHWLVSTPHIVIQSNNTKYYKIKTCIDSNREGVLKPTKQTPSHKPWTKLLLLVTFHSLQTRGLVVCSHDTRLSCFGLLCIFTSRICVHVQEGGLSQSS